MAITHGSKRGEAAVPPLRGGKRRGRRGPGSPYNNVAWAEVYFRTKCHLDPSSCLATIDMGRKLGGSTPFWGRGAKSPSNIMSLRLC